MNRTNIEWVRNPDGSPGYTFNPITGCLNHNNGLCKGGGFPCYAYKLANGRLRERYLGNHNVIPDYDDLISALEDIEDPFYPRFWPERIPQDKFHYFGKLKQVKPKGIFVCDMGELFGNWIPKEWQEQIFRVITLNPWHRFYLLTKQPQNLIKFSPFPDNCWVGVTATNHDMFYEAFKHLSQIKATVKFISIEPFLSRIAIAVIPLKASGVKQIIIGAQTKPYKPPRIEWVEEIVRAADQAGIPVFLKDNLKPILPQGTVYGDPYFKLPYGNEEGYLRQELPQEAK